MPPLFQLIADVGTEGPEVDRAYASQMQRSFNSFSAGLLLAGLRSGAPGAWSDNRYEQARHFLGVSYTAINAKCNAVASSQLFITRPRREESERFMDDGSPAMQTGRPQRSRRTRAAGTAAPIHLLRRREALEESHPLHKLLDCPNPHDTWEDFLYEIELQVCLTGSALIWQVPNGLKDRAVPVELYVIPTALAQPLPISSYYRNGAYRITPLSPYGPFAMLPGPVSGGAVIPGEQITRIMYKNPLFRYDGYSPQTAGAVQMDILEMIDRSRWVAHQVGIHPSAAISIDPIKGANVTPELLERLQKQLDERFSGYNNYGKLMILPPGASVQPWANAPASMGFETGWEQMRDFDLSLYGVPKGVVGIMDSYTYAGLYAALKGFYLLSVQPDIQRIGAHFTKFLAPYFGEDLRVHLELPKIDDPQLLEVQIANDLKGQVRTRNEIRALRGLEPLDGPEGDELAGMIKETEKLEPGQEGGNANAESAEGANPLGREFDNLAAGGALGAEKNMPAGFQRRMARAAQLNGKLHHAAIE